MSTCEQNPSEVGAVTRERLEKALPLVERMRHREVDALQDWANIYELLRFPDLQQFMED